MLPAIRAEIARRGTIVPVLPRTLEKLYKVRLPMDQKLKPNTFQKLIADKHLPPGFKTTEVESEAEAMKLWA